MGLKPAIGDKFIQKYEFTSGIELGTNNTLKLELPSAGPTMSSLTLASDWIPAFLFKNRKLLAKAPVVFAGYGIVATPTTAQAGYDSYASLDVKDKWAVVFSGLPESIGNDRRYFLQMYARIQNKALAARQRWCSGLDSSSRTCANAQRELCV